MLARSSASALLRPPRLALASLAHPPSACQRTLGTGASSSLSAATAPAAAWRPSAPVLSKSAHLFSSPPRRELRTVRPDDGASHVVHVTSFANNTTVALATSTGDVLGFKSGGMVGMARNARGSPEAGAKAGKAMAELALSLGVKSVRIQYKGIGLGRDPAIEAVVKSGIAITGFYNKTPIPFNGTRPPKRKNK